MTTQAFVNVVIPFDAAVADAVEAFACGLPDPERGNLPRKEINARLDSIGTLHFMSITVARPVCPSETERLPRTPRPRNKALAHLLIEVSADGTVESTLEALADSIGPELLALLHAARVDPGTTPLPVFLRRHAPVIGTSWFSTLGQTFSGSPGMSVRRILAEQELAARVGKMIADAAADTSVASLSPRQRLDRVREALWRDGDTSWAFVPEQTTCLDGTPSLGPRTYLRAVAMGSLTLLWPLILVFLGICLAVLLTTWRSHGPMLAAMWTTQVALLLSVAISIAGVGLYWRLRHLEDTDPAEDRTPSASQVEQIMKRENYCAQNHLASVSRLKAGVLRRLTLRLAFFIVGLGRDFCAPGFLGRNGVIHFARWMRLPGTDQLLFWSNYDDTWESYVADFIAEAPTGVTAIWSNCVGFPRSRQLFGGGAADRDKLVRWARRQQHPTLFWYTAYPGLTTARIRLNAAIRQGIASALSDADASDWLACFGSAPKPAPALHLPEIPTLAFGGLSRLRFGEGHVLTLGEEKNQCCEWLKTLEPAYGEYEALPGRQSAVMIAFSVTGLSKLGLSEEALATFPVAFQHGMWPDWRARALGDTGRNAPKEWHWGGPNNSPADVLLLSYGTSRQALDEVRPALLETAVRFGHRVVHTIDLAELPEKHKPQPGEARDGRTELPREPFGFVDGVSQPVMLRSSRAARNDDEIHAIAPGEIILGYPDNLNSIPPSPSLAGLHDPGHDLPDLGTDPFKHRPQFSQYESSGRRDLGSNGTYLVVRQLEQDVEAFDGWLQAAADKLPQRIHGKCSATQTDVKTWIAAKLIGRWPDGTSLVRYPNAPGTQSDPDAAIDNDFLFGLEDPAGLCCPLGAHIRRANPRDSLSPSAHIRGDDPRASFASGSCEQIAISNRHRILRIGRPYRNDTVSQKQGLLFMCLNADIERQFEFIQKSWLLNPSFHSLEDEADPILGHGRKSREMTIPTSQGPIRLPELTDLVTVRGGGYFFLPGKRMLQFLGGAKTL